MKTRETAMAKRRLKRGRGWHAWVVKHTTEKGKWVKVKFIEVE
jgi:hypothetical protein